jgi:RNA polymerase sigma factor (sigma-70 family)
MDINALELAESTLTIEELCIVNELPKLIEKTIEKLPRHEREVLKLSILEHMPIKEIANSLDKSVENIKTYIRRGKNKVYKMIG